MNKKNITVRLTPGSSSNRIGGVECLPDGSEQWKVYVTAPPEDGKANAAMLKIVAKHLGVAPSSLRLLRGCKGRAKVIGWV